MIDMSSLEDEHNQKPLPQPPIHPELRKFEGFADKDIKNGYTRSIVEYKWKNSYHQDLNERLKTTVVETPIEDMKSFARSTRWDCDDG